MSAYFDWAVTPPHSIRNLELVVHCEAQVVTRAGHDACVYTRFRRIEWRLLRSHYGSGRTVELARHKSLPSTVLPNCWVASER